MMEEPLLERLLDEIAQEIAVPVDGAERVVHDLSVSVHRMRRPSPRITRALMVAAVIVIIGGLAVVMKGGSSSSPTLSAEQQLRAENAKVGDATSARRTPAVHGPASRPATTPTKSVAGLQGNFGAQGPAGAAGATGATGAAGAVVTLPGLANQPSAFGAVDGAKIIKTGTLDLQVPHGALRPAVNRITSVAVGLGGYVADSKTSYDVADATAQITIRVPVGNFEAAITQLDRLPDVKVLGDSENGTDVTAQYTNLEAQLGAATTERDSLLGVLANASSIGDILAVRDRISSVQSEMDQLQGRINVLNGQSSFSSIAITTTEKQLPAKKATPAARPAAPPTGLSKAWADSRQGFSNGVEWFVARSGGALIVLLAALILLFGLRRLYPIMRRALL